MFGILPTERNMRKLLFIAILLAATGCSSVPADVVESIGVLRDNTHKLAQNYGALLERSTAPAGHALETNEQEAARLEAWAKRKTHQRLLMSANNTLADKVYEWAEVSKEEDPTENTEEDSDANEGS